MQFSCGGKGMFITGSVFAFPSFIIYAIGTYFLLIVANVYVEIIKQTFDNGLGALPLTSACTSHLPLLVSVPSNSLHV